MSHCISGWMLIRLTKRKHRLLTKRNSGTHSHDINERIKEVCRRVSEIKKHLTKKAADAKFWHQVSYKTKWKNFNNLLGRKTDNKHITHLNGLNGTASVDPTEIANNFNDFFTEIDPLSALTPAVVFENIPSVCVSLYISPSSCDEVFSLINSLKMKKSVGRFQLLYWKTEIQFITTFIWYLQ